jgi:hypothetical protein
LGPERGNTLITKKDVGQMPGPSDYIIEQTPGKDGKHDKESRPFGVNAKRFGKDDTIVPGPGQYVVPSSVKVN